MALPPPDSFALAHSERLRTLLVEEIHAAGGWLSFARFMALALYAPGLGYYAAGASKFGQSGDFVTAPEITPLFAAALSRQLAQLMQASAPAVIEVGAGTGRLAADLLTALAAQAALPEQYSILELSADLRARQAETLQKRVPHLVDRVRWLDQLPAQFAGVVVANELIDAMPVHRVCWSAEGPVEQGVELDAAGHFRWGNRPTAGVLQSTAEVLAQAAVLRDAPLPVGYTSEINLAGPAWAASWGNILTQGAVLLIDYGFPTHEFYHPQRDTGTLMCHYRHHAHPDPFIWPGLQDMTAHVDFTALIEAAFPAGMELLGYTSQGQFLLNCGLLECLAEVTGGDYTTPQAVRATQAVNQLTLPQEMGELFKVIAMGKGINVPLLGFQRGDRSHQL